MSSVLTSSKKLAVALGLTLVAATSATAPVHAAPGSSCSPVKRALMTLVALRYVNIINLRDPALFPLVFSQDLVLDSTAGQTDGLAEYSGLMAAVYAGLPDIHYEIDELLIDGDDFVLRYHYVGTHLGELFGFAPTGNVITCSGLEIDRVAHGKIYESVNFTDLSCLLAGLSGQ